MKKFILFALFITMISANDQESYPLFGTVKDVASDDKLFVHTQATHRSQKIGGLPNNAKVAVQSCQMVGRSTWCKISQLPGHRYGDFKSGWVNARYLNLNNKGYVSIEGKKNNCYYALFCNHNRCIVVTSFTYDAMIDRVLEVQKEKIHRSKIIQSDKFGAMKQGEDGYCTLHSMLNRAP